MDTRTKPALTGKPANMYGKLMANMPSRPAVEKPNRNSKLKEMSKTLSEKKDKKDMKKQPSIAPLAKF